MLSQKFIPGDVVCYYEEPKLMGKQCPVHGIVLAERIALPKDKAADKIKKSKRPRVWCYWGCIGTVGFTYEDNVELCIGIRK